MSRPMTFLRFQVLETALLPAAGAIGPGALHQSLLVRTSFPAAQHQARRLSRRVDTIRSRRHGTDHEAWLDS